MNATSRYVALLMQFPNSDGGPSETAAYRALYDAERELASTQASWDADKTRMAELLQEAIKAKLDVQAEVARLTAKLAELRAKLTCIASCDSRQVGYGAAIKDALAAMDAGEQAAPARSPTLSDKHNSPPVPESFDEYLSLPDAEKVALAHPDATKYKHAAPASLATAKETP